jgi:hypothetical protein
MLFLSFLLVSALYIDGENYVKIYRSSSEIDLFFVERGFFNPALGFGIVGADLNPAVLGKTDDVGFFTAFSLPGVSSSDVNSFTIEVEEDDRDVTNDVIVTDQSRLYGQYSSLGGINFVGFSKRFGMFGVGISYGSGYRLGVEASLSGSVYGSFEPDEPFELTHDDFSQIPLGDVISVNPRISGGISLDNLVPLKVEYSDAPIFLGGGLNKGPVSVGAGLKFQKCGIMGEGSFSARIDSFIVRVEDTVIVDDGGDSWIIRDLSAELDLDEDLFNGTISSNGLSATHTVFTLGTLFDFAGMKLSMGFDFGASYELAGGYQWSFSAISDFPEDFAVIDSTNLTIIQDSLVTGTAIITIDSMIRDGDSEFVADTTFTFSGSSFNFSFLLDLPLKIGFNGRFGFPSSDYSLNKLGLCLYSRLPVPVIGVDLGLAADCVFLGGSEVDEFIFIPSATLGLSFSYEKDYLCFYLPVKYDVSHIASAVLNSIIEDEEDEDLNLDMGGSSSIWDNLAFGLGFRVKM